MVCHEKLIHSSVNDACAGTDADWLFLATQITAALKATFCHDGQQEWLIKPRKQLTKANLSFYRHISEECILWLWSKVIFLLQGEVEGICTKSSLSPLTSLSSHTKVPKLGPPGAAWEDPLLLKGLCQPRRQVTAGQPSVHVTAILTLSEAPHPIASPCPFLSKKYWLPGVSLGKWFSQATQQQLRVCILSRHQVIFVPFKSILGISVALTATE